jgi:hypothetical protein
MSIGQILLGLLVACGFFVSAAVSRIFRRNMAGIVIGGVSGIALSVFVLTYGLTEVFGTAAPAAAN